MVYPNLSYRQRTRSQVLINIYHMIKHGRNKSGYDIAHVILGKNLALSAALISERFSISIFSSKKILSSLSAKSRMLYDKEA